MKDNYDVKSKSLTWQKISSGYGINISIISDITDWAKRDRHAICPRDPRPTTVKEKQKFKETNARPDKDIWQGQKSVHGKINLLPARQSQLTAGRENTGLVGVVDHRHAAKQRNWIGQRFLLANVYSFVCEVNE